MPLGLRCTLETLQGIVACALLCSCFYLLPAARRGDSDCCMCMNLHALSARSAAIVQQDMPLQRSQHVPLSILHACLVPQYGLVCFGSPTQSGVCVKHIKWTLDNACMPASCTHSKVLHPYVKLAGCQSSRGHV